jgi:hypothetical protein
VGAYLTDYKSQTDSKMQDEYSRKFSCYLLSTCWKKIVRRIKSWQAAGFIRFLDNIPPSVIGEQGEKWDQFPSCIKTGDKTLMDFLRHASAQTKNAQMEKPPIQSLLLDYILSSDLSKVNDLLSISRSKSAPLFSKKTVGGFHALVTGALKGFAYVFLQISIEYAKLVSMDCQALEM